MEPYQTPFPKTMVAMCGFYGKKRGELYMFPTKGLNGREGEKRSMWQMKSSVVLEFEEDDGGR